MKKLCFVVHRYFPYQGGSEVFTLAMAEECVRRGHDVTVLTGEAEFGVRNGVKVTFDFGILQDQYFDLVIVHGADVHVQNVVLEAASRFKSPVLYLIILPSESRIAMYGLENSKFIGCSTQADFNHATKHGYQNKIVSVRHSIPDRFEDVLGEPGIFKKIMKIETPYMFLSAGGFWPHKGMDELAEAFESCNRDDVTLVLTGYQNPEFVPPERKNVRSFICEDRRDVLNAMADADLYIMNSTQEGFGLVLLEAMANKTPWISRHIAGAVELKAYGYTYHSKEELKYILKRFPDDLPYMSNFHDDRVLEIGHNYVKDCRQIGNTVDDIEAVLKKCTP